MSPLHRFDDAPHDRRRGLRAAAAFLDDRDHDVLRRVGREVRGEQRRVTSALFRAPTCAVPVLPATGMMSSGKPWNGAYAVPFSSAVTPANPASISARTFGSNGDLPDRLRRERAAATGAASRSRDVAAPMCGFHSVPPFANAAYAFASCSGVDGHAALPDRHEDVVGRIPLAVLAPLLVGRPDRVRDRLLPLGVGNVPGASSSSTPVVRAEAELARRRLQPEPALGVAVFHACQNSLPAV